MGLEPINFPKLEIKDNRIFINGKDITHNLKSMNLDIQAPDLAIAKLEIYVNVFDLKNEEE